MQRVFPVLTQLLPLELQSRQAQTDRVANMETCFHIKFIICSSNCLLSHAPLYVCPLGVMGDYINSFTSGYSFASNTVGHEGVTSSVDLNIAQ
jgi:hypothetical protein